MAKRVAEKQITSSTCDGDTSEEVSASDATCHGRTVGVSFLFPPAQEEQPGTFTRASAEELRDRQ